MTKETGGSAFPMLSNIEHNPDWIIDEGMSLRDYFAGQALQGLIANGQSKEDGINGIKVCAELSYKFADAMLEMMGEKMINLHAITCPTSKIIALQGLADELAKRADCKTAYAITMSQLTKLELRLENSYKERVSI